MRPLLGTVQENLCRQNNFRDFQPPVDVVNDEVRIDIVHKIEEEGGGQEAQHRFEG